MLSKFSVKKPYTVVVAVVLVLILGYVSFDKMTVDLLPDMNLPYAVVMTTYPGASPEEVEATVTKPVEQAMATISNIKNVSSSSMENASTVILEFEQTANMDSATIEMRESLDQIKGYWPDTVGNPIIMKMNPTMLPVMIPAVSVEGADAAETTRIIKEEVLPELESLEGVASVNMYGDVEETIRVTIKKAKSAAWTPVSRTSWTGSSRKQRMRWPRPKPRSRTARARWKPEWERRQASLARQSSRSPRETRS